MTITVTVYEGGKAVENVPSTNLAVAIEYLHQAFEVAEDEGIGVTVEVVFDGR